MHIGFTGPGLFTANNMAALVNKFVHFDRSKFRHGMIDEIFLSDKF